MIENGSRQTISAKQTSTEPGLSSWCFMTRIGPAPDDVGGTVEQRLLRQSNAGRRQEVYCQTFGSMSAYCMRPVKRRLENKAIVLVEP
jgi:hypothetical protein